MARDTKHVKFTATLIDLQHDGQGWSANGCTVHKFTFTLPNGCDDLDISKAARKAAGLTGNASWRRDGWAGTEYCWRNGCMGFYVDDMVDYV